MTDWDAVELDYRAGVMPEIEICRKHKITTNQLSTAARDRGWTRRVLSPEDEATVYAIAHRVQSHPRFPCDSLFDADEVKKIHLMTAGQVIREHRSDISKLRGLTKEILVRVEHYLETDDAKPMIKMLGPKESASDLIEKCSRIMTRSIALERQAYGLESMSIDNVDGEENPMAKDIRDLTAKLREITEQKAQKVEPAAEKAPSEVKR